MHQSDEEFRATLSEEGKVLFDATNWGEPQKDVCGNCGLARQDHKMTRRGPICPNGRKFKKTAPS